MHRPRSPIRFALALGMAVLPLRGIERAFAAPDIAYVQQALVDLGTARFGKDSEIRIEGLQVFSHATAVERITPEPGARIGAPARFIIWSARARAGYAVATVHVRAMHPRAAHDLARDATVEAADVVWDLSDLAGAALVAPPRPDELVGARTRRTVTAGEAMTTLVVAPVPAVRSGDTVEARVRTGDVEVVARAVASGSGRVGDVIRIRSLGAKRLVPARVTGRGSVEVMR